MRAAICVISLLRRRADFEDRAVRRLGLEIGLDLRAEAEGKLALAVEADQPFAPAFRRLDVMAHRKGVEEFIGDEDRRSRRAVVDGRVPGHGSRWRPSLSPAASARTSLASTRCTSSAAKKLRRGPRRAQSVGHQRAAARPELDQPQRRGRADLHPRSAPPRGRSIRRTSARFRARSRNRPRRRRDRAWCNSPW